MKRFSKAKLSALIVKLNEVVAEADQESTLDGLTLTAYAFAALLDIYAKPNPNNQQGMCDDPAAFRKFFAELIEKGGRK